MSTFVLVHGAWQGGWCWKRVASLLRQAGHDVVTPTMTGLGERAHLLTDKVDLYTHIEDILAVIHCEGLSDFILCGHSYGGMVITGVADQLHENVQSLIYLDALVPADGQSALDVLPEDLAAGLQNNRGNIGVAPAPAEAFSVNMEDRAWVDRLNTDHPYRTFAQPIRLADSWKQVHRKTYIYATGWQPGIGQPFFDRAQQETDWTAHSMACGHYAMIDMPEELTQLLMTSV